MKKESVKEVKKMEGRHNLVKKLRSPDIKEKLLSSPPLSASSSDGEEWVESIVLGMHFYLEIHW